MGNLQFVKDKNIVITVNEQLFLEILPMEIRGKIKCISYSLFRKSLDTRKKTISEEIKAVERN